jgi:hypothetical protein
MPDQSHPPYAAGALTIPRTLIRWLDVNPQNGQLRRTQTFITLPSFNQGNSTWNGYSDIVASFNFESPNGFSLTGLSANVPANPNYTLCISYRVGNILTRYILWLAAGSNLNQSIPYYTNQPIKKNFRFEVWNTSQGAASQATSVTMYTTVLGGQDYRYGLDVALVNNDGENDSFAANADFIVSKSITFSGWSINGDVGFNNHEFIQTTPHSASPYINSYEISGYRIDIRNTTPYTWILANTNTNTDLMSYQETSNTNLLLPDVGAWQVLQAPYTKGSQNGNNVAMGVYLLPLVFPSTSVSVTN